MGHQLYKGFPHDNLVGQFAVSREERHLPEGWSRASLHGWHLATERALPAVEIRSSRGPVGWLIGYAVGPDGRFVDDAVEFNGDEEAFEAFVYGFAGRFAVFRTDDSGGRVYVDPGGSLHTVYCPSARIVASTPCLIPYSDETGDDEALMGALGIPERNGMYPFQETSRFGVYRIMANHCLDLRTWSQHRHWPSRDFDDTTNPADTVERIGAAVRRNIEGFASKYPVRVALTSGRDSRMLLACARRIVSELEFFTLQLPMDEIAQRDVYIATRIASRFGLRHQVVPFVEPDEEHVQRWLHRSAWLVGERRGRRTSRSYGTFDRTQVELLGIGGEVGTTSYFKDGARFGDRISPETLPGIVGLPDHPTLRRSAARWLDELPAMRPSSIYPLILLELRGAWSGLLPYADAPASRFRVYPFNARDVYEPMMQLPADYRRESRLARDLVGMYWPELLSFPFNRFTGPRQVVRQIKRTIWLLRSGGAS